MDGKETRMWMKSKTNKAAPCYYCTDQALILHLVYIFISRHVEAKNPILMIGAFLLLLPCAPLWSKGRKLQRGQRAIVSQCKQMPVNHQLRPLTRHHQQCYQAHSTGKSWKCNPVLIFCLSRCRRDSAWPLSLHVADYDTAIDYYVNKLGFGAARGYRSWKWEALGGSSFSRWDKCTSHRASCWSTSARCSREPIWR